MAALKDVQDQIATLKDHITTEAAEVKATVAALNEQIVALRARLDAGGIGVTPADLDTVLASLADLQAGIDGIITPPDPAEAPGA